MGDLRLGLAALFDELKVDPGRPQSVARALEVDKTLAWRACRFLRAQEPTEALGFLPGETALASLLAAARTHGAAPSRVAAAVEASAALHALARRHAGGRQGLKRLVANLDAEQGRSGLQEDGRRQAFRGNVAIWGVQASARVGFHAVAPNAEDPALLDLLSVGGVHELQRLRTSARWPIIRQMAYGSDGPRSARSEPLDPSVGPDEPPLMRDFCSPDLPRLRARAVRDGTVHELVDGGLGRSAAVTCLFGTMQRGAAPRCAQGSEEHGELLTFLNTPVERAVVDVALHQDLADLGTPELQLCSLMESAVDFGPDDGSRYVLPVVERVTELDRAHPVIETPCLPRYREMVRFGLERLRHGVSDFHFFRVEMTHPPIPTVAVLRLALPRG